MSATKKKKNSKMSAVMGPTNNGRVSNDMAAYLHDNNSRASSSNSSVGGGSLEPPRYPHGPGMDGPMDIGRFNSSHGLDGGHGYPGGGKMSPNVTPGYPNMYNGSYPPGGRYGRTDIPMGYGGMSSSPALSPHQQHQGMPNGQHSMPGGNSNRYGNMMNNNQPMRVSSPQRGAGFPPAGYPGAPPAPGSRGFMDGGAPQGSVAPPTSTTQSNSTPMLNQLLQYSSEDKPAPQSRLYDEYHYQGPQSRCWAPGDERVKMHSNSTMRSQYGGQAPQMYPGGGYPPHLQPHHMPGYPPGPPGSQQGGPGFNPHQQQPGYGPPPHSGGFPQGYHPNQYPMPGGMGPHPPPHGAQYEFNQASHGGDGRPGVGEEGRVEGTQEYSPYNNHIRSPNVAQQSIPSRPTSTGGPTMGHPDPQNPSMDNSVSPFSDKRTSRKKKLSPDGKSKPKAKKKKKTNEPILQDISSGDEALSDCSSSTEVYSQITPTSTPPPSNSPPLPFSSANQNREDSSKPRPGPWEGPQGTVIDTLHRPMVEPISPTPSKQKTGMSDKPGRDPSLDNSTRNSNDKNQQRYPGNSTMDGNFVQNSTGNPSQGGHGNNYGSNYNMAEMKGEQNNMASNGPTSQNTEPNQTNSSSLSSSSQVMPNFNHPTMMSPNNTSVVSSPPHMPAHPGQQGQPNPSDGPSHQYGSQPMPGPQGGYPPNSGGPAHPHMGGYNASMMGGGPPGMHGQPGQYYPQHPGQYGRPAGYMGGQRGDGPPNDMYNQQRYGGPGGYHGGPQGGYPPHMSGNVPPYVNQMRGGQIDPHYGPPHNSSHGPGMNDSRSLSPSYRHPPSSQTDMPPHYMGPSAPPVGPNPASIGSNAPSMGPGGPSMGPGGQGFWTNSDRVLPPSSLSKEVGPPPPRSGGQWVTNMQGMSGGGVVVEGGDGRRSSDLHDGYKRYDVPPADLQSRGTTFQHNNASDLGQGHDGNGVKVDQYGGASGVIDSHPPSINSNSSRPSSGFHPTHDASNESLMSGGVPQMSGSDLLDEIRSESGGKRSQDRPSSTASSDQLSSGRASKPPQLDSPHMMGSQHAPSPTPSRSSIMSPPPPSSSLPLNAQDSSISTTPNSKIASESSTYKKILDMGPEPERKIFLDRLFEFMSNKRLPITSVPVICKQTVDLFRLYTLVNERGGMLEDDVKLRQEGHPALKNLPHSQHVYNVFVILLGEARLLSFAKNNGDKTLVTKQKKWREVSTALNLGASSSAGFTLKKNYGKFLFPFECKFDRGDIDPNPILASLEASSKRESKKNSAEKADRDRNSTDQDGYGPGYPGGPGPGYEGGQRMQDPYNEARAPGGHMYVDDQGYPRPQYDQEGFGPGYPGYSSPGQGGQRFEGYGSGGARPDGMMGPPGQNKSNMMPPPNGGDTNSNYGNRWTPPPYGPQFGPQAQYSITSGEGPVNSSPAFSKAGPTGQQQPQRFQSWQRGSGGSATIGPAGLMSPVRDRITFPQGSVESTRPTVTKHKRLTPRDIGPVDMWRVMMSLKSGLACECVWALDVLTVLLADDNSAHHLSLPNLPGLLETLLEHLRGNLIEAFKEDFDELEISAEQQASRSPVHDSFIEDLKERVMCAAAYKPSAEEGNYTLRTRNGKSVFVDRSVPLDESLFDIKDWDLNREFDSSMFDWQMGRGDTTSHIVNLGLKEEQVPFSSRHYFGSGFSAELNKDEKVPPSNVENCSNENKSLAGDCVVIKQEDIVRVKVEENEELDNGEEIIVKKCVSRCGEREDTLPPNLVEEARHCSKSETVKNENSLELLMNNFDNVMFSCTQLETIKKFCTEVNDEAPKRTDCDPASIVQLSDSRAGLVKRCVTLCTLLRNLSFISGNENELCKHSGLLALVGKLLLLKHSHPVRPNKPTPSSTVTRESLGLGGEGKDGNTVCENGHERNGENSNAEKTVDTSNHSPVKDLNGSVSEMGDKMVKSPEADEKKSVEVEETFDATKEWWWDVVEEMREASAIILANISSHLDLSALPEEICMPLLDGLLHLSICPSTSTAPDNNLSRCSVSLQRLSIEALCKLCVTESNVDLVLATPPFSRVVLLLSNLVSMLGEKHLPVVREFSVSLLSSLVPADVSIARAFALQRSAISFLLDFIEEADVEKAAPIAPVPGSGRSGRKHAEAAADKSGISLDMVRRASTILCHLADVAENTPLISRYDYRLKNLLLSQNLDNSVHSILARVLASCS